MTSSLLHVAPSLIFCRRTPCPTPNQQNVTNYITSVFLYKATLLPFASDFPQSWLLTLTMPQLVKVVKFKWTKAENCSFVMSYLLMLARLHFSILVFFPNLSKWTRADLCSFFTPNLSRGPEIVPKSNSCSVGSTKWVLSNLKSLKPFGNWLWA